MSDGISEPDIQALQAAVQRNCHISDARFASDYTLCVYLLKMREFYRWECGRGLGEPLSGDEVGDWLSSREALWETLEDEPFAPLPIDGSEYDPFDDDAINAALMPHGLLYSGGYGAKSKPLFFLARLERSVEENGFRVHVAGAELARDLTAPPAMAAGEAIYVRRESLRRMLWERVEEWRWNRPDNAMGRALGCYDFDADLHDALERMADSEIDTLVLHEIGEVQAGRELGEAWHALILGFPRSRVELMARAVRDHLADALSTLPTLLERGHPPSLHFYFANFGGMRRELYPALLAAYEHWAQDGDDSALLRQVEAGRAHWLAVARQIMELHAQRGDEAASAIETLIGHSKL